MSSEELDRCEAYNVVSPTSTLEERRCRNERGDLVFRSSYGQRALCNQHAKSYKESGFELHIGKMFYTSETVRASLALKVDFYFAKLSIGQSPTWKCDQRTKDIFCLYQWLIDELTAVKCTDEDRRHMQWYFNRKSRAEDDLFSLAAKVMNNTLDGKIDQYKGK